MSDGILVNIEELVIDARKIEPLPLNALRLLEMAMSPSINLQDVIAIVSLDPALTASVLRMSNSAISAPGRAITTVHDAVIRLGLDLVLASAVSMGVASRFSAFDDEKHSLWRYSVTASMAANFIRTRADTKIPPAVVASALLLDIGKIVLNHYVATSPVFKASSEYKFARKPEPALATIESLHTNHAFLGGIISEFWGLPDLITAAIAQHHDPSGSVEPTVWATYLAEVVAARISQADDSLYADDPNFAKAHEILKLPPTAIDHVIATVRRDLDATLAALTFTRSF